MPHGSQNAFKVTLARKAARDRKKDNDISSKKPIGSFTKDELIFPKVSEK